MAAIQHPQSLTPQELRLRTYLRVLIFIYLGGVFLYLLPAVLGVPGILQPYPFINDPAFANNSTIKMGLFAVLCFLGAADVRKYLVAVEAIIITMLFAVLSGLLLFFFARNNYTMTVGGRPLTIRTMILYSTIFDAIINAVLIILYRSAQRARYRVSYLSPMQFRTLQALAEVVIQGEKELLTPCEVAGNVDRYMTSFKAKSKWISKLALIGIEIYPLFFLRPPVSYMRPEDRKDFLERHFYQNVSLRLAPPLIRMLVQAMIRMGKQLCFMGYYNDEKVFASIGYVPFSKRKDKQERMERFAPPEAKPLVVKTDQDIRTDRYHWDDVVIIGSGPGASILAKGLIEKGRRVLMVERGDYVDPSTFSEDEIEMVSSLYADGALQLASDFRFQVIQGNTVGGSSVVNNAVCFDTPDAVLAHWNDDLKSGIDIDRFKSSNKKVNGMIGVHTINDAPLPLTVKEYLNPGGKLFEKGCAEMGINQLPNKVDAVAANIAGCVGCGYCNMGCAYGRKLSMATNILPSLQKHYGEEQLRIIAGCEVGKIRSRGKRIVSVLAKFSNGRKIEITGKTFVVAAGAISSSLLLQQSGIAVGRAGKHLSFNIGSPMSAVFKDVINAYDGLQISHYLQLSPGRGYIFETWFNPPMFQSTVMPGWWDDHFRNMSRYNRMACTGVLVGSEANGEVRNAGLTRRDIRYTPTKKDFNTLLDGLELAGDIYLAAGAECVMPNTFAYYEFKKGEMKKLRQVIKDSSDITIGTGHPQGGNIISLDPKKGVVDNELKVYGYDNLFISDASVFPGSVGVNPQVTVMTFADYAVPFVAST